MKGTTTPWAALTLLLLSASSVVAQTTVATPSPTVALKAITYKGCYKNAEPLEDQGSYTFQSAGWCQKVCAVINKPVMATTKGSNCWCGDELPSSIYKVSDSHCNTPCDGFGTSMCGGDTTFSVSLDGLSDNVDTFGEAAAASASQTAAGSSTGTKTAGPSVITEAGQTIVVTATNNTSSSKSGPSKASIAAGVVVGVIVLCAIAGGAFFFYRARKRRAVEEEYRRNAAINSFVSNAKKGGTSVGSDSRLDPSIIVQRRASDGSIADNQDYSRRILRVANPDDRA